MESQIIFYQLFEKETSTFTYLLGDPETREAILIDPVIETINRDMQLIKELELKIKYILDTHVHADHITGAGEIRFLTGAKIGVSSAYNLSCSDLQLQDGDELNFGKYVVKVLHTPGHTSGCLSYQIGNMVFTGDALLIRGCGRTDFQEGSSEKLFHSVRDKIFNLPDDTFIYPGHDYKGFSKSSIGIEKKFNPRLKLEINQEQFIRIMSEVKLEAPKKIHEAVPANLRCGFLKK
jgi:sulfur dioxygenase